MSIIADSIIVDAETGPLPMEQLKAVGAQFVPPPHPGEFDPEVVKYGNTKDEEKRAAKLKAARDAHAATVANHKKAVATAETEHWAGIQSKAALDPRTGRVLAVGYLSVKSGKIVLDVTLDANDPEQERSLLARFWIQVEKCKIQNRRIVGHNFHEFDLPFMAGRSWIHGMEFPSIFDSRGYPDGKLFADTMKLWTCGQHGKRVSLNSLAVAMGVGAKPEGIDGAMFADLLESDPMAARAYLENDLKMTAAVAERMGLK